MKKGRLVMLVGCMSSGKSRELFHRLRRAEFAKHKTIVFKAKLDDRNDEKSIASRDGTHHVAVEVSSARDMCDLVDESHNVVGIDEVQFFNESIIAVVDELINRAKRVIAAGLDTNFRGEPFGSVPQLMAMADVVRQFSAICLVCGNKAIRTQRLIDGKPASYDSPLIQVGGDELYEARCRNCHEVPRGEKVDLGEVVYQ